ncbi:MAG: NUDIX domain-containing protein [Desertifilum sp. SIO1I2]|nr:NUDIX domain-containing protein [Desertifilum sp. SIO1I2]
MHPSPIRVLSLGLIRQGDRTFLAQGYDSVTQKAFYRALGGGLEFGESSLDALKREFQEEIDAELTDIQYLCTIENRFVSNGKPGHEIIFLYQCDFADPKFYQIETLPFLDAGGMLKFTALWVDIAQCLSGELFVVPSEFLRYLH